MARKENEKVGIFNCHGMGGNQVNCSAERRSIPKQTWKKCVSQRVFSVRPPSGFLLHGQQGDQDGRLVPGRVQAQRTRHDAQVPSPEGKPAVGVRPRGESLTRTHSHCQLFYFVSGTS